MTKTNWLLVPLVFLATLGLAFTFSTPGDDGWVAGEAVTATHMNEIDSGLDALQAGTSIAAAITRDIEWDTVGEIETAAGSVNIILATEIDTMSELEAIAAGANILIATEVDTSAEAQALGLQAYDADLAAVAALTTTATGLSILDDASTSAMRTTLGVAIGTNVQAWDTDLDDLADGSLTGSKVGAGVPDASVASTITRDTEWDTIAEIETATSVNVIVSTEIPTFTTSASAASGNCTVGDLWLKTSATATLYGCTATNTWTAL